MPFDLHTVEVVDGSTGLNNSDKLIVGLQFGVASLAGGSAGAAVTTAVTFSQELPASYGVFVTPHNASSASVDVPVASMTSSGFNVVLTPNPATATLAAGTFDVLVVA